MSLKAALLVLAIAWNGVVFSEKVDTTDFDSEVTVAVRNLSGLNCITESVLDLEDAAAEFKFQINKKCSQSAGADLATQLKDARVLIKQTTELLNINDNDCDNAAFDEDWDGKRKPSYNCRRNYQKQLTQVYLANVKATKDIETGLRDTSNTSLCQKKAMQSFHSSLINFVNLVSECKTVSEKQK